MKYTHEFFVEKLSNVYPGYAVLSKYINSKTKIKVKCNNGHIIEKIPSALLFKSGCLLCGFESTRKALSHSNEDFLKILKEKSPELTPLEPYNTKGIRIAVKCSKGHFFRSKPKILLRGYGCPDCGGSKPLTLEVLQEKVNEILPGYTVVGPYKNNKTDIAAVCDKGHKYQVKPKKMLIGHKCNLCSPTKQSNTEEFVNKLILVSPTIKVVGEYTNNKVRIAVECRKGHVFYAKPNNLLNGSNCPLCKHPRKKENQCREIFERLLSKAFPTVRLKIMERLELDGYSEELDLAFEYDGECHYMSYYGKEALEKTRKCDIKKDMLCGKHGIRLIRISYLHNDDLERYITQQLKKMGLI